MAWLCLVLSYMGSIIKDMEFSRFRLNRKLDIEPEQSDIDEAGEDAPKKQLELEDYVKTDGVVLNSPSLEPATAEDFEA